MAHRFILNVGDGNIVKVECHETLASTLDLARIYARLGYPDKYIVFSESQTKVSATGEPLKSGERESGVYISCILRPSIFPAQAGFLGAMSAVAMISAIEEHTTKELGLGWVSDIYCEGRKIGSASAEGKLDDFSSYEYVIVSFAAKLTNADFPPRLTDLVKKVFESENAPIAMIIAKNILSKFLAMFPKNLKSPEKFMETYRQKFILTGQRVTYISNGGKRKSGKILSVDSSNGTLIIENNSGELKRISNQKSVIIPKKIKIKQK